MAKFTLVLTFVLAGDGPLDFTMVNQRFPLVLRDGNSPDFLRMYCEFTAQRLDAYYAGIAYRDAMGRDWMLCESTQMETGYQTRDC
jgi:hypothetical protein